jgi:hypothetical protein
MLLCLLPLLCAADVDPEPPSAKKVIVAADWYAVRYAGPLLRAHLVLTSAAELVEAMPALSDRSAAPQTVQKEASAAAAKALGVKEIDWKKQMLIVVAAGGQRSHGHRVEVVGLKAKAGTLTVSWKLHRPKDDADCVKTFPATLALVPAHKGKVVFEQKK